MFELGKHSQPGLVADIAATERSVDDLSREALANSVVQAEIKHCQYPFLNLPHLPVLCIDAMSPVPAAGPRFISSVHLSVDYNRQKRLFRPNVALLNMDNGYTFAVRRLNSMPSDPQDGSLPFLGVPLTPAKLPAVPASDWTVMTESTATDLLRRVGITLPQHEQPASWDEITGILQFAGDWSASTSHSVLLEDLRRTVHIGEFVVGGITKTRRTVLPEGDGLRYREVRVSIDEAPLVCELPDTSWQVMGRSPTLAETPCIQTLRRVPLEFTPSDVNMLADGDIWRGDWKRTELEDQALDLPLDRMVLEAVRGALDEARFALL